MKVGKYEHSRVFPLVHQSHINLAHFLAWCFSWTFPWSDCEFTPNLSTMLGLLDDKEEGCRSSKGDVAFLLGAICSTRAITADDNSTGAERWGWEGSIDGDLGAVVHIPDLYVAPFRGWGLSHRFWSTPPPPVLFLMLLTGLWAAPQTGPPPEVELPVLVPLNRPWRAWLLPPLSPLLLVCK